MRKPRDKAKVENGVLVVERWLLAPLRDRIFFSLHEANQALKVLLTELNDRPFQKLAGSRASAFEELDKPCLRPLPAQPYTLATWKNAKVHIDYHVEAAGHYYSVPYTLSQERVELRLTRDTVEVFHQGARVASHQRAPDLPRYRGAHTTIPEHMPPAHRHRAGWSPERLVGWARETGEHTARVVQEIMRSRPHPEQGFRSCLGLLNLSKSYGPGRLEAACRRACHFRAYSLKSVRSILKSGLDSERLSVPSDDATGDETAASRHHCNVRGAGYYGKS